MSSTQVLLNMLQLCVVNIQKQQHTETQTEMNESVSPTVQILSVLSFLKTVSAFRCRPERVLTICIIKGISGFVPWDDA